MKRFLKPAWALTLALAGLAWAQESPPGAEPPLSAELPALLSYAREHNLSFAAYGHEAQAAQERAMAAGALPDPVLRIELDDVARQNAARTTTYTLMQALPLWGKRGLVRDVAGAQAAQAQSQASVQWQLLAASLKQTQAQYVAALKSKQITQELLALAARTEQLAQSRYTQGLAAQQDVIRAQLEQTALRAELLSQQAQIQQARASLNALLGRPGHAALSAPENFRPLPEVGLAQLQALGQRALQSNPAVHEQSAALRAAELQADLERRGRKPDVSVGLMPMQMGSRIVSWGLMLEMSLPLPRQARLSQERAALAQAQAQAARGQALQSAVQAELAGQLAALSSARETLTLLRTQWLVQAQLAVAAAQNAYEAGRGDFAALLDAQRLWRQAQLGVVQQEVNAQARLAELERLVGEELSPEN